MRFNANFWSLAEKEQKVNDWNAHIKWTNNERGNYRYRFKYFILGLFSLIYKSFVLYTKIRSCIQFAKKSLESNEPTFMGEEIPPCWCSYFMGLCTTNTTSKFISTSGKLVYFFNKIDLKNWY